MSAIKLAFSLSAAASALVMAGAASAQAVGAPEASVDMFSRDKNTSVQGRSRPDYEADGVPLGAFTVYPKLELAEEYNDNIYATSTNEIDDFVFHARPEVSIDSNWSVHRLAAYARASINRFNDASKENTTDYAAGASGTLDLSRVTSFSGGADYTDSYEPRTSPSAPRGAVSPVEYETTQGYISAISTHNRWRLGGRADIRAFNYHDGVNPLGGVIDQDTRDRDVSSVSGRVDYAVSPDTAFFVQATYNKREYDIASTLADPNRDSEGAEYLAGASFELGNLARGEVAAGYIEQDFDEPTYKDSSGLAGRAQIEYFPTQLTTVTFVAGKSIDDAVNRGVGAFVTTSGSVRVDHELLRNVILTGRLSYSNEDYQGIDRTDERKGASVGATYLLNRALGVTLTASAQDVNSSGADRDTDYSVNKLAVSLVAQF